MPVVWTGAAGKFLSSQDPSSPAVNSLIHNARKVAGGIVNSIQLGETWYGCRKVPIASGVEVSATVISNFPDLEPLVRLQILVGGEPPEEEEEGTKKICIPGFVLSWPTWFDNEGRDPEMYFSGENLLVVPDYYSPEEVPNQSAVINFDTLVSNPRTDSEVITSAKGSYKRVIEYGSQVDAYTRGIQVGYIDWHGRGPDYVLTWLPIGMINPRAMAGDIYALQALSSTRAKYFWAHATGGSPAIAHCGRIKAAVPAGHSVLGAAVEEREDSLFINAVCNTDSNRSLLKFFTRPWSGGPSVPFEEVSSIEVPWSMTPRQPFHFNASGSKAIGLVQAWRNWDQPDVLDGWRYAYSNEASSISAMVFGEVELHSDFTVLTNYKKVEQYAVIPDIGNSTYSVDTHPRLGDEADFPVAMAGSNKIPIAVDWKGDTVTRCTITLLKEACVLDYNWQETAGGALPRTDSGIFTGKFQDMLVEFENSALPAFYMFHLQNDGDYEVVIASDGAISSCSNNHSHTLLVKRMLDIDLRYDFLCVAETTTNTSFNKTSRESNSPSRTVDTTWKVYKGNAIDNEYSEPQWTQTLWRAYGSPNLLDTNPGYLPDFWSATLAFLGPNPLNMLFGAFTSPDYIYVSYGAPSQETTYQGLAHPENHNYTALHVYGAPFIDHRTNFAAFHDQIYMYRHISAWREDNNYSQDNNIAVPTGQSEERTRVKSPDINVNLHAQLGIGSGNTKLQYKNGTLLDIFNITIV